jgi:peptidoglycan LD-endopeptidase LytH
MKKNSYLLITLLLLIISLLTPIQTNGEEQDLNQNGKKEHLLKALETLTGVPWEYLAAIDQFESNIHKKKNQGKLSSIQIPSYVWAGLVNPNPNDVNPLSIQFFHGIGKDVNGDGIADPHNDAEILYSIAKYLTQRGTSEKEIRKQIWSYYQQPVTVDVITHIAKIFHKFQSIHLEKNVFPIPLRNRYSYLSSWGDKRGFGGLRIHEGTDIFSYYGTPVLSTCYGYIELVGWNRFGGWRIGIRDIKNNYHYFAHLKFFRKGLKKGDIVQPGEVIGAVGSSGYGPPGTQGKFPPHLHFGIYKFNGQYTYSYDPYPLLKKWERDSRLKPKKKNQTKIKKWEPRNQPKIKKWQPNNNPGIKKWQPKNNSGIKKWQPKGNPKIKKWQPKNNPGIKKWQPKNNSKIKKWQPKNKQVN